MLTITLLGTAATMPLPGPRPHGGGSRMRRTQPPVRLRRGDPGRRPPGRGQFDEAGRDLPDSLPWRPYLWSAGSAADAGLSGPYPSAGALRACRAGCHLACPAHPDRAAAVSHPGPAAGQRPRRPCGLWLACGGTAAAHPHPAPGAQPGGMRSRCPGPDDSCPKRPWRWACLWQTGKKLQHGETVQVREWAVTPAELLGPPRRGAEIRLLRGYGSLPGAGVSGSGRRPAPLRCHLCGAGAGSPGQTVRPQHLRAERSPRRPGRGKAALARPLFAHDHGAGGVPALCAGGVPGGRSAAFDGKQLTLQFEEELHG